jgi:hypothetical protein
VIHRLADLLADPRQAVDVPTDAIPTVLREVSDEEARLGTVKVILAARLAAPVPATNKRDPDPVVDDVHEVARIVRRSVSWVRKRGHTLPGFRQPGGKGTRVAWSCRALEAWVARPASPTSC